MSKHSLLPLHENKEFAEIENDENEDRVSQNYLKRKLRKIARKIVIRPTSITPMPQAIAAVIRDAAGDVVEEMMPNVGEDFVVTNSRRDLFPDGVDVKPSDERRERIENAFAAAEEAVSRAQEALEALQDVKTEIALLKTEALDAILDIENATTLAAMSGSNDGKASVSADISDLSTLTDISDLSYEDIDFSLSEMAPPFIGDDQCLVPGVPLCRVEKAPENSRRIFAGIDIMSSVDSVWEALTDYAHLQDIVPNLVVNEVLESYNPSLDPEIDVSGSLPKDEQCKLLSLTTKGAKLRQVGGAKVVGINFSARTTLEVREWPNGLPDFAHFNDDVYKGKTRNKRIQEGKSLPLKRYTFPRPFAISKLPTKDISMQSVENDDGEFRMYQGVWRMQPLPGCSPKGDSAMRLTYAVEISPRAYLPVQLVEKRIAKDLCNNLEAIRDFVTKKA